MQHHQLHDQRNFIMHQGGISWTHNYESIVKYDNHNTEFILIKRKQIK